MNEPDFTCEFNNISDKRDRLKMVGHATQSVHYPKIIVKDFHFRYEKRKRFSRLMADFVDLAVAVYAADRLSKHPDSEQCSILVILPVRCCEIFTDINTIKLLQDTLYWYTNNHWKFEFKQRSDEGRNSELQLCIPERHRLNEVALWSGGLDSLAGFMTRWLSCPQQQFTLFGTGSDKSMIGCQRKLIKTLRDRGWAQVNFYQAPFYLEDDDNLPKNSSLRSRGFTFTLLGMVCAFLEGQSTLHIYENGVGAINLPYPGGVGLDHSRAVHPLSLSKMGRLVTHCLEETFNFINPFLFWTKSQMCEIFCQNKDIEDLIFKTVTCDGRFRKKNQPVQCGFCSSCLLRRQSLMAQNIKDQTKYVITHGNLPQSDPSLHFQAMLGQVETIRTALDTEQPWLHLSKSYPELGKVVRMITQYDIDAHIYQNNLLNLYRNYVNEWDRSKSIISVGVVDAKISEQAA